MEKGALLRTQTVLAVVQSLDYELP